MLSNGKITPCPGWHQDNQVCGNAAFNGKAIANVAVGQSLEQVRATMRHDPERRTIATVDSNTVETWSYITDYDAELMTVITFTNGKVTALGQEAWKPRNT
jgi:hypothetical protein